MPKEKEKKKKKKREREEKDKKKGKMKPRGDINVNVKVCPHPSYGPHRGGFIPSGRKKSPKIQPEVLSRRKRKGGGYKDKDKDKGREKWIITLGAGIVDKDRAKLACPSAGFMLQHLMAVSHWFWSNQDTRGFQATGKDQVKHFPLLVTVRECTNAQLEDRSCRSALTAKC